MRVKHAYALLWLVVTLFFYPAWLQGRVFVATDIVNFVQPWKSDLNSPTVHNLELLDVGLFYYPDDCFLNASLKKQRFPLWNPNRFCGQTFVGDGQSALLYWPRNLAHYFLSPGQARTLMQYAHLLLMGWGLIFWLSYRGISPPAALLGAFVWCFNGWTMSSLEYEFVVVIGAYLAPCLYCVDQILYQKRWSHIFPLALFSGVFISGGHLQFAFVQGLLISAYVAFHTVQKARWKQLPWVLLAALGGIAISSTTTVPFLELLARGQRSQWDWEALHFQAATLSSYLFTLLGGELLGNPTSNFLMNRCQANLVFNEFACYLGIIPLLLAIALVLCPGPTPKAESVQPTAAPALEQPTFWLLVMASALLIAPASWFYWPLFKLIPLLQKFVPGRVLHDFVFAGAVIAAIGFDQLQRPEYAKRVIQLARGLGALWLVVVLSAWVALNGFPNQLAELIAPYCTGANFKLPPADSQQIQPKEMVNLAKQYYLWRWFFYVPLVSSLALIAAKANQRAWLLPLVLAADLLPFGMNYNTNLPDQSALPVTASLKAFPLGSPQFRIEKIQCASFNSLEALGVQILGGYDSVMPKRFLDLMKIAEPSGRVTMRTISLTSVEHRLLDAYNVGFVLYGSHLAGPDSSSRWKPVYLGAIKVYQNTQCLPRTYLASQLAVCPDWNSMEALLRSPNYDPHQTTIVEEPPPSELGLDSKTADSSTSQVKLTNYEPNEVQLSTKLDRPSLVVLADTHYPGWRAYDQSGTERPIVRTQGNLRGVYLPAGEWTISFRFLPSHFFWLNLISLVATGLCLIGVFWTTRPALPLDSNVENEPRADR